MALLSGRYELGEVIGEGVSAVVRRAVDTRTGSVVAVKILNPHLHTDAISIERFRREIQITRFIGHPQIVSIYDLVVEGEQIYLVMEYVRGSDLKRFIALRDRVGVDVVVEVLGQILRILAVCHAKNVVHRDLKPQNVMIGDDHRVTLLDFGISRMTTLSDLTRTGTSLGSPEYMAPELFSSNTYDPRTDIYALGVIVFELLTGRLPFDGDSLPVLCRQHLEAPVPSIRARRPEVPAWLEQLTEKMLAKNGHHRHQTADEVLSDLERRTVTSRQILTLEKRECLACGRPTIAEVPFCTFCGDDHGGGFRRGTYDVWSPDVVDPAALRAYLRTLFGTEPPTLGKKTPLLATSVDAEDAELLRRSALRHGIALAVRKRSAFASARMLFSLAGCGVSALIAALAFARSVVEPYAHDPMMQSVLPLHVEFLMDVVRGVLFVVLAWFCLGVFRRETMRPLIPNACLVEQRVGADHGWLRRVVATSPAGSESTRTLLPVMIEKYLVLSRSGGSAAEIEGLLRRVLGAAAELSSAAAQVELRLDAAGAERLTADYTALARQLEAETGDEARRALESRLATVSSRLEELYALQDAHGALLNKLIQLHALFNRLLGKVISRRLPLEHADAELLDASLRTLDDDVSVARQVRADLARVA